MRELKGICMEKRDKFSIGDLRLFKEIVSVIPNGVVIVDSKGGIMFFNKAAENIFQIPMEKAINRFILDVLPNTGKGLLDIIQSGVGVNGKILRGKRVTLVANISPIKIGKGLIGAVSVFQDISEIDKISDELQSVKKLNRRTEAIIESCYDGLFITDGNGKVIKANKASLRLNDLKENDVIGKNVSQLVEAGFFDISVTIEVLRKRMPVSFIQSVRNGRKLLVTGNPVFDDSGKIIYVVTSERDVTLLEELKERIKESEREMRRIKSIEIVANSKEIKNALETALRVARFNSTVLILGESGVGKELFAKIIHDGSQRKEKPFIDIDCSAIPETLIEAELFGYEKGAFTGAKPEGKLGLIELANGGTLFLDEIGELPHNLQVKLLKFLDHMEFTRLGGIRKRKVDVRVISATNRDIQDMIHNGRFREDLYYRISAVTITLAPLRERKEDIPGLIEFFLNKMNQLYSLSKTIEHKALEVLYNYNYPGNVRELANIIEQLLVINDTDVIKVNDLPKMLFKSIAKDEEALSLNELVGKLEFEKITHALKKYGSTRKAASALGISQSTVVRKLKRLKVNGDSLGNQ
ncbi:MAG TPA: sigma 54-interacting transcriptional regulator [Thermodesulfobacteriota bacterium]